MSKIQSLVASLALAVSAGAAQAQMLTSSDYGESFAVEYAPGHLGNIAGGGAVELVGGVQDGQILYRDASFAKQWPGIAMDMGGESPLVYLPPAPASTMITVR